MGGCQNYGPFLGPYYNTAPIIEGIQKGTLILTTTHMLIPKGPRSQIVGFQSPKTIQSMDLGTKNPTIWVLGPSGYS